MARDDGVQGSVPNFQVDVRRRRKRKRKRFAFDVKPRRVADKRSAIRQIEIRNVMRSVPRRVNNIQVAASESERFSALEHAQIPKGHRKRFAKQVAELARPKPVRGSEKLRRISH